MPKMVNFGEFLKTWSLRSNSVTRQVSFNRTKIGGKCQNSNAAFWVIFKHCVEVWIWSCQITSLNFVNNFNSSPKTLDETFSFFFLLLTIRHQRDSSKNSWKAQPHKWISRKFSCRYYENAMMMQSEAHCIIIILLESGNCFGKKL